MDNAWTANAGSRIGEILHVEKFDVKNKPKITFHGMLE